MGLEDRVEELEEEVEKLKEKRDSRREEDEEDEDKKLYIYLCYVYEERETVFGRMDDKKILLIEEDDGYTVPHSPVAEYASTTRQVIRMVKELGVDAWEEVKQKARTDEAVYYTVRMREEDADTVEKGFWVDEREAINLVTDWEVREYID